MGAWSKLPMPFNAADQRLTTGERARVKIRRIASGTDDWSKLTEMTGGESVTIERVRTDSSNIAIEGEFRLPPLAKVSGADQIFVAAFLHCHGNIRQMERWFGVSYPTIKNQFLTRLENGEISATDALQQLSR